MILDQSLVWAQTYNLQWGNGTCLKDSTGQPSAQTGFDTSYFNSEPPASAKNFFGAQVKWSYPEASKSQSASPSVSTMAPGSTVTSAPAPNATGAGASVQAMTFCGTLIVVIACAILI